MYVCKEQHFLLTNLHMLSNNRYCLHSKQTNGDLNTYRTIKEIKYTNQRITTSYLSTDGTFIKERNTTNVLGYNGKLVDAFASLLKKLWTGQHEKLSPHSILVNAHMCMYSCSMNVCMYVCILEPVSGLQF